MHFGCCSRRLGSDGDPFSGPTNHSRWGRRNGEVHFRFREEDELNGTLAATTGLAKLWQSTLVAGIGEKRFDDSQRARGMETERGVLAGIRSARSRGTTHTIGEV